MYLTGATSTKASYYVSVHCKLQHYLPDLCNIHLAHCTGIPCLASHSANMVISPQTDITMEVGHVCPVCAQVGSLRMVLSLEELGPAIQQTPHQGPVDTATAAAAAAAQPTASLGAAAQPAALPAQAQAASAGGQQAAAKPVPAAQQAAGSTMPGRLTMHCVCIVAASLCAVTAV